MKNLKEFKELIITYRGITLAQINEYWEARGEAEEVAFALTGYGSTAQCTLCVAVDDATSCDNCMYSEIITWKDSEGVPCNSGPNKETYDDIYYSTSPEELLQAFKSRADYMEKILEKLNAK